MALAEAQALLGEVMAGTPAALELPSEADAARFLQEIRSAGADGRIDE